jgi:hypothetical protein
MRQLLTSGARVALGFVLGTLFSWGSGQALQDLLAHHVPRPATNDAEALAAFLAALPPQAHAGRLVGLGLGVLLGVAFVRRLPGSRPLEAWALALMFGLGVVADVLRVPHGNALSIATVVLILPSAWMGIRWASRAPR